MPAMLCFSIPVFYQVWNKSIRSYQPSLGTCRASSCDSSPSCTHLPCASSVPGVSSSSSFRNGARGIQFPPFRDCSRGFQSTRTALSWNMAPFVPVLALVGSMRASRVHPLEKLREFQSKNQAAQREFILLKIERKKKNKYIHPQYKEQFSNPWSSPWRLPPPGRAEGA